MDNLPSFFYVVQMDSFGHITATKMFEGVMTIITKFKPDGFNVGQLTEDDDSYFLHLKNITRDVRFIYEENVPETLSEQRRVYEELVREAKKFLNEL